MKPNVFKTKLVLPLEWYLDKNGKMTPDVHPVFRVERGTLLTHQYVELAAAAIAGHYTDWFIEMVAGAAEILDDQAPSLDVDPTMLDEILDDWKLLNSMKASKLARIVCQEWIPAVLSDMNDPEFAKELDLVGDFVKRLRELASLIGK